jgi:hypothetical protein
MKSPGLFVAAFILAALSGVLYWSNHRKPAGDVVKASPDAPPKILSLSEADVTSLAIKKKGAPEVDLAKKDGSWQITEPKPLPADQEEVSSVLSTLSFLNSERLVEDKAASLAPYGLASPSLEIDVTTKDKTHKLLIGDATPTGAEYAALVGDPRVFTISSYSKTSLDKSANDLRDKRVFTADLDKVSQIEITAKKQTFTLARSKDEWQILKPGPYRADSTQVDDLVRALKDAKFDMPAGLDEKKNASLFSSGAAVATAKVTGASGTQTLEVRKNKDDYYAKSSAVDGVYKVANTLGTSLDKSLDDFRNKKLFTFGYTDPSKIELHDGAKAYFFTHSSSGWWGPDGKQLDSATVSPLLDKLRDLAATKFPASGFAKPEISITVISNDGKSTDQVAIAKAGDNYIAKRAGEPALYELGYPAVAAIQEAAVNVKTAPPPAAPAAPPKTKK